MKTWRDVIAQAVEWIGLVALCLIIAQCSTGAMW